MVTMSPEIKQPSLCTDAEIAAFCCFVRQGDEVEPEGLEGRVRRRGVALVFLWVDRVLVGVGALKRPDKGYRDGTFRSAGVAKGRGCLPTGARLDLRAQGASPQGVLPGSRNSSHDPGRRCCRVCDDESRQRADEAEPRAPWVQDERQCLEVEARGAQARPIRGEPPNNEMNLTRSAKAGRRGPRRLSRCCADLRESDVGKWSGVRAQVVALMGVSFFGCRLPCPGSGETLRARTVALHDAISRERYRR